jgi:hypothetical protein
LRVVGDVASMGQQHKRDASAHQPIAEDDHVNLWGSRMRVDNKAYVPYATIVGSQANAAVAS